MAFIQCDFFSRVLGLSTSMNVILPESGQKNVPTLYLLHGLSDDHTIWMRRTSIERYAAAYELAVVMPAVHRSFYTDMANGYRYWTFISEEVPRIAQSLFPLSTQREHNFAAGLSMGGYGAFKLALRCPDKFAAGASLSGALDIVGRLDEVPDDSLRREFKFIFGDDENTRGSENDLFHLASNLVRSGGPIPMLYQCCGTEDFLYEGNRRFLDHCRSIGLDITYEEEPGEHEWGYWDKKIQRVLEWLPIKRLNDN